MAAFRCATGIAAAAITACWRPPPDEPIVEIQLLDHESRVRIDIETDDIPAEVGRLEKLGAKVVDRRGVG
jgi:hypothetical protein